ncbi:hypothetical protein DAPPUDRAFT_346030 [Daphnia pulex]|uniref:Uncharacterized protein n=1 Tax=Daphnia pulex TaxID=6669 RepID=E9I7P2_DAPPU|nr:hypothetical protein DAPPUDRAFT_346030 [Daphnia pulex]|eukprot:EFX59988.1 hypothetical protein DAPPUDRAFT_346030 [Daphnia pulex]
MGGDDLFQRHEPLAVLGGQEARERGRQLETGETLLTVLGVVHPDRQIEREVADVGERVAGIDGQRGEDREDAAVELGPEVLLVETVELVPLAESDAAFGENGNDLVEEDAVGPSREHRHLARDQADLLRRREPVGAQVGDPGLHLVEQACGPHLEELVEILAEDGEELGALERRRGGIGGDGEDAFVELEPRQLTVDESTRISFHGVNGTDVSRHSFGAERLQPARRGSVPRPFTCCSPRRGPGDIGPAYVAGRSGPSARLETEVYRR